MVKMNARLACGALLFSVILCLGKTESNNEISKIADSILKKVDHYLKREVRENLLSPSQQLRNRRNVNGNRGETFDEFWTRSQSAFREILIRTLLISKKAIQSVPIGHLLGILLRVYDVSSGSKVDVWSQVKEKVRVEIAKSLGKYHFDVMSGIFEEFLAKQTYLNETDYQSYAVDILSKKYYMLPQNFEDLGYSEELATLLPAWTMYAVASITDLIKAGYIKDKCRLTKELKQLRNDTIEAALSLTLKRYKALQGVKSSDSGTTVQLKDSFTGLIDTSYSSSGCTTCSKVKQATYNSLMAKLITPMNSYFGPEFCYDQCQNDCPEPIKKNDFDFTLDEACLGTVSPGSYCKMPCKKYKSDFYWCPYGDSWKRCQPPNWKTCYDTTRSTARSEHFERVVNRHGSHLLSSRD